MPDETSLEAEILVEAYGLSTPLVRLAELAAPACRIEPQLLRQLRLACVPDADVSVEQELWFSELVDSRGKTIIFRESVSRVLRRRVRQLSQLQPELVGRARAVTTDLHANLSPLLILEDELAWAEVFDDDDSIRAGAQTLLRSLLARRDGLDHWLGRAWSGLPATLKRLPEGQQLAQVAAARGAPIEEASSPFELAKVAHLIAPTPLLMRREGSRLDLNVDPMQATHLIEIPATRPRALGVATKSSSQDVVFGATEMRALEVGLGIVVLRTLAGYEYELEAIAGENSQLEIEMLPANHGTSLLISYGDASARRRVLVDCGPQRTGRLLAERLRQNKPAAREIELLVLTHIDDDRIGGAIALLENPDVDLHPRDVWFNSYAQIRQHSKETLSPLQGDILSALLRTKQLPWNIAWSGGPVVVSETRLPVHEMPGGLRITLLSPRDQDLKRLAERWQEVVNRAGYVPGTNALFEDRAAPQSDAPSLREAGDERRGRLFISYAHGDEQWASHIRTYLKAAQHDADVWDDTEIKPGEEWEARLREAIDRADVALLLVSVRFLSSTYLMEQELRALLERANERQLRVTWVLLGPCPWERTPLANIQALLDVSRPLESLDAKAREQALGDIARRVAAWLAPGSEETLGGASQDLSEPLDLEALANAPFVADQAVANIASIAFLAEFADQALLIGGDAGAEVLAESIRKLLMERRMPRLPVSAFVVPHSGSARNLSRELLELLDCDRYLISTDGALFRHPDRQAIARIIRYGGAVGKSLTLVFNYQTQWNKGWANPHLQARYHYQATYPTHGDAGIKVRI